MSSSAINSDFGDKYYVLKAKTMSAKISTSCYLSWNVAFNDEIAELIRNFLAVRYW